MPSSARLGKLPHPAPFMEYQNDRTRSRARHCRRHAPRRPSQRPPSTHRRFDSGSCLRCSHLEAANESRESGALPRCSPDPMLGGCARSALRSVAASLPPDEPVARLLLCFVRVAACLGSLVSLAQASLLSSLARRCAMMTPTLTEELHLVLEEDPARGEELGLVDLLYGQRHLVHVRRLRVPRLGHTLDQEVYATVRRK